MSQTSIERLRDYLGQLPPQSQALLMREFERAIERGEETAIASLVLEQLRNVVRGTAQEAQPRIEDPAVIVPTARTVSARRKWTGTARADPPLIAAPRLAMAEPRWRPRRGARN